jgi:hypothetical protein
MLTVKTNAAALISLSGPSWVLWYKDAACLRARHESQAASNFENNNTYPNPNSIQTEEHNPASLIDRSHDEYE